MTDSRLERWSLLVTRHPGRVALCAALLGAVFLHSLTNIQFENDIRSTVPTPSGQVLDRIDEVFGLREQSFVLIESSEPDSHSVLLAFARVIDKKLSGNELVAKVDYGHGKLRDIVLEKLAPYGPRFTTAMDAQDIESLFSREDLNARLDRQLARLSMPGFGDTEDLVLRDPLDFGAFLFDRLAAARGAYRVDPSSPYTISADGRAILIRIQGSRPLDDLGAAQATALAIEEALYETAREVTEGAEIRIVAGGGHFLALESARTVRKDLIFSLTMSMFLVIWLTGWTLRSLQAGFLVFPPLSIGLLSGIGLLGLFKPRMTLLALGSSSILIGLGVDFAVHLLLRARTERAAGHGSEASVARAMNTAGPGLIFAALTTMGAFLAFHASAFDFLEDMGSLTALGIFGTLAATLSLLPPLLERWLRTDASVGRAPRTLGVDAVVAWSVRHARTVLIAATLLSVGTIVTLMISPPKMETDLRRIHARDSHALNAEERLKTIFGGDEEPLFVMLENANENELEQDLGKLRAVLDKLVSEGLLISYQSAAMLLPDKTIENAVRARMQSMSTEELHLRIGAALDRAGFDPEVLREAVDRVVDASTDHMPFSLARLRELGLGDWLTNFVRRVPDAEATVALSTIYPAEDLWVPAHREQTLTRLEGALTAAGIEAKIAGMVTVSTEAGMQIGTEMATIGSLALAATVLLVALLFRSPGITLLVLLPVTLGCLWTALGFWLCDFRLHFMNASVLPMILGIGIDDGIHLVKRYRSLSQAGKTTDVIRETFAVTGTGVALTSLTTMIAFGSLGFSENRGLASIGILAFIGVGASLVASVVVLPAVMAVVAGTSRRQFR
jgi:predicted RND superfamily exporter protein